MKRSRAVLAGVGAAMLVCAGVAQAAYVEPTSHDYGSEPVGASSGSTSFTLTTTANNCTNYDFGLNMCLQSTNYTTDTSALGGGPGSTARSGDFLIQNDTCSYPSDPSPPVAGPVTIGTPVICQFEVSFSPTAGGARSRVLVFPDTSGSDGSLSLTGTGLTTGQQAAAIKRCKKKFRKGSSKRKKCLGHAQQLPV